MRPNLTIEKYAKTDKPMTHDERWQQMWQTCIDFMRLNKRRPSKYAPAERPLVNWLKHNRKLLNQGKMPERRKAAFDRLLAEADKYRHVNQYVRASREASLPLFANGEA